LAFSDLPLISSILFVPASVSKPEAVKHDGLQHRVGGGLVWFHDPQNKFPVHLHFPGFSSSHFFFEHENINTLMANSFDSSPHFTAFSYYHWHFT